MRKIHPQIVIAATILLLSAIVALADDSTNTAAANLKRELERLHNIATNQEPIGSRTSWVRTTNSDNHIVAHMHNDTSGSNWIVYAGSVHISLPYTFNETNSGIRLFIESDGRHITATGADAKILWRRDPFADAHLEFYRTTNPIIIYVGWADKRTGKVAIGFNSSQFGDLDIKTGDFFFGGQD